MSDDNINSMAEITLTIDGGRYPLRLTLGALAELEAALEEQTRERTSSKEEEG